ncbi:hypothetical protein GF402_10755 [Candidatus Fermentibacteria bacterium]|nr:hypothetical protein [Candidatus Fermentibacteria bacterium]
MPAFLLILRKGRLVIPLPYFLLWGLLLPLLPLLILAGMLGKAFSERIEFRMITRSDLLLRLLVCVHGLKVRVGEGRRQLCMSFL